MNKKIKTYVMYVFLIVICLCVVILYIFQVGKRPDKLEVYFFDTKGTPSILIRTPDDKMVLIDGGANSGIIRNITSVLPFYSRRIDVIIVANNNGDKVTGLIDVVTRYDVGSIVMSSSTDRAYLTLIDLADKRGIYIQNKQNEIYMPNSDKSVPALRLVPLVGSVWNIFYGNNSILLLGDAGLKVQKSQINTNCSTDVLFIPHSVSANSLSLDLMNRICPKHVIYSQAGSNSKFVSNKPDPLYMIMKENRYNLKNLIRDSNETKNTIEVLSDGNSIEIR